MTLTPTIAVCVSQKLLIVTLYTTAEIFRIHLVLSLRKIILSDHDDTAAFTVDSV